MTRDNVPVTVDAVVYFRVVDAEAAIIKVENFLKATSLIAQTTLRSVIGQAELDELLAQRERINQTLQEIIDRQTEPWGVKVTAVEVKDVVLPDSMKRSMAGQAESERERRSKIINAEGEFQAAEKLVQAGRLMAGEPIALQLRFLQTMREIASERSTTTFLPIPMDLFSPFMKPGAGDSAEGGSSGAWRLKNSVHSLRLRRNAGRAMPAFPGKVRPSPPRKLCRCATPSCVRACRARRLSFPAMKRNLRTTSVPSPTDG